MQLLRRVEAYLAMKEVIPDMLGCASVLLSVPITRREIKDTYLREQEVLTWNEVDSSQSLNEPDPCASGGVCGKQMTQRK